MRQWENVPMRDYANIELLSLNQIKEEKERLVIYS